MPVTSSGQMAPGRVSRLLASGAVAPSRSSSPKVGRTPAAPHRSSSVASAASSPMNTTSAGTHPPEGQTRANSAYRTASVSGPAPVVSVVLPVRDVGTTIGEQLAALSVQDFTGRWEVVVADN